MKLGLAVFILFALGVSSAEAARKYPKPIDSPIVRSKVRENHKPGTRVKHLMEGSRIGDAAVPSDAARA